MSLKESIGSCRSFAQIGCVLCWWIIAGTELSLVEKAAVSFLGDFLQSKVADVQSYQSKKRGMIFPLREGDLHEVASFLKQTRLECVFEDKLAEEWSSKAWQYVVFCCLNRLAGAAACPLKGRWTLSERRAAASIAGYVESRLARDHRGAGLSEEAWQKDLASRQVGYGGEEVSICHKLSWEQVLPGLPPETHGGCVDCLDWVGPRTREFLLSPQTLVKDVAEISLPERMGKIHAVEGDLLKIACELVRRRICSWVPLDNVFEVRGRKILNGLFGVAKTSTLDSGAPVLRLIMNLTGSNSTQRQLFGGCSTLPMITSWQSIVMDDGERLNMFQSDMSSAFYLFRLPLCWAPYLCFNVTVKGTEVGLDNRLFALGCCVIPMGWINSVGIMQEISENLLKHQTLTLSSQVARGRPLPPWFTALLAEARSDNTCWWHIYLDNFCAGERLGASSATDWGRQCHEAAERCWREAGVISSEKKRVAGEITVQELGAEINGELGTLGISTAKLEKLCLTTLWALAQPRIERKTVQIIAGRWMFALQFRRPGMSLLQAVWKYVGGKEKATEKLLRQVRGELFSLVCCAPLFQCNLRAAVAPLVVASDASNSGGAVGVSETLTQEGKDFVSTTERIERGIPCQPAPVLLVSLFNRIGGCFRAYDIAGLLPMGRIAVEINEDANRITARHWPGTLQIKDIHTITRSVVREWSARFLQVAEIHVWAGFPCQDLCGAKAGRKNLMGKNSSLFWEIPRVVTLIKEEFGTTVVVKEVLENVQSMDKAAAEEISRAFGAWPYGLDCVDAVPLRRPRFCWTTEVIEGVIPGVVVESKSYWRQVQAQAEYPKTEQWIDPGFHWNGDGRDIVFPTCMRSIPRQAPPPKPAGLEKCSETTVQRWREDSFRYPPYQYQSQYLLCSDASWRLLNANEKELLLGYGWQHTKTAWSASRIKQNKVGYSDVRNSLLGDSFSIFSFVILAVVCSKRFLPTIPYVVLAGRMGLAPGFRAALRCSAPLARRLQYGFSTQDGSSISVEHLNRLLLRKTNHTGSDVRVITGEIMNAKTYPRQSVAAQWWHWREVFSKKWGHKQHINCLELESILMGVKYQILHHRVLDMRIFQISDSYVAISVVSKGRSSSWRLQKILNKVSAHLLAFGLQLILSHIESTENPTDVGSRRYGG